MAALNRAYTSEYSTLGKPYVPGQWAYGVTQHMPQQAPQAPQKQPPRVKKEKLAQVPEISEVPQPATQSGLTPKMLAKAIILMILAGAVLISTIWMSARATEIKYEINQVKSENTILQNEIAMLDIKIESANSIETIEEYATDELNMQYPKASQCIYVAAGEKASADLVDRIKEKAYTEE